MKYLGHIFILSIALLLCSTESIRAQATNFELAKQFTTQKMSEMTGSTSVSPNWVKGTDNFWYKYETSEGSSWYFVDVSKKSKSKLFDRKLLASKLSELLHTPINHKQLAIKDLEYKAGQHYITFQKDSIDFRYDINSDKLTKEGVIRGTSSDEWKTYSPDSTWIAFARKHDLYLMRADDPDSTEYRLTNNGERWFSYQTEEGDTNSIKRLKSRAQWFKDSKKLYVHRQDKRKIPSLWVINYLPNPRPTLNTYKYVMPSEENTPIDEYRVFDTDTKTNTNGVKLDTEKESWENESIGGTYFKDRGIYIGTGSDYLYMLRRNREWNEIEVLKSNTTTGETVVLFTETEMPKFNVGFAQLAVIDNGKEYLWWSERTGWGQLYRYDSNGKLINNITEGYYKVGDIVKIDTTNKAVYFNGYGRDEGMNPYYAQLYRANFDGSGMKRLTTERATHRISASEENNYFVDNFSRVDMPTQSVLRDKDGNIILNLEQTNVSAIKELGWKPPQSFTVKAADGITDLYGVMWKPFDFDSTKSYPIISYVYPGPQTEPFPINFSFSGNRGNDALAQVGFIVVAMGQRGGSPYRSKYYHTFGYGDMRDYPLKDNKYGIEQLASRHDYIDINRVGIWGHSGGGNMSAAEILTYPDFYKVAWSESGNHDNNIYNIWWGEYYNGVKQKTKTIKVDNGYGGKKDSTITVFDGRVETNIELAKNLKGHLMLVTGTADDNVHPANTIRLADALIKANKRFDYMILPDKPHGFQNYKPYVERRRWDYFARHLLGYQPMNINYDIPQKGNPNR